jgi:hypothetical protein
MRNAGSLATTKRSGAAPRSAARGSRRSTGDAHKHLDPLEPHGRKHWRTTHPWLPITAPASVRSSADGGVEHVPVRVHAVSRKTIAQLLGGRAISASVDRRVAGPPIGFQPGLLSSNNKNLWVLRIPVFDRSPTSAPIGGPAARRSTIKRNNERYSDLWEQSARCCSGQALPFQGDDISADEEHREKQDQAQAN